MKIIPTRSFALPIVAGFACVLTGFLVGRHSTLFTAETRSTAATSSASPSSFSTSIAQENPPASLIDTSRAPAATDLAQLLAGPCAPATDARIFSSLQSLAATQPALALQLAQSARTPRQRDECIRATLQGWGSTDPIAAAHWTLANVRLGERRLAVESLLTGAIADPDAAIRAITFLCNADPLLQSDHGNTLITELTRAGRFDLAAQFASTAPGEFRAYWLSTAFAQWARYQPASAIAAAEKFPDTTTRADALQGVISGWSASDPASLVTYAATLPPGDLRASALRDGLQQWVSLDPVAASAWMDRLDPSTELDAGAAAVATTPVIVEKKPGVATSWAESIVDPELRANTLLDLISLWSTTDPAAARSYAATSPALRPQTRAVALASFTERSGP